MSQFNRFTPMAKVKVAKKAASGEIFVDYKDLKTLRSMIDREGNMLARRKTGNCAKFQRAVREAILRARFIGLLPYVAEE